MALSRWCAASTLFVLVALIGCGSEGTVTSLSTESSLSDVQSSANGVFSLSEPVEATEAAGLIQINIATEQPLPDTLFIQETAFVAAPIELADGYRSYIAKADSALNPLAAFSELELPVTQANVTVTPTTTTGDTASLIYQGDSSVVTFADFVLVLALSNLPPNQRTPEAIATQANDLFAAGNFTSEALDPVPTAMNTDFVLGGSVPAPDLLDAAVVYAATFLPPELRTATNLALTVNALVPGANISAESIQAIPGVTLPGGVTLTPVVGPITAGEIQISVQIPPADLETPDFTVGPVNFIRSGIEAFPGFTSYAADPAAAFLTVEFGQLMIPDVDDATCIIVHDPGTNPLVPANQIATSAACVLQNETVSFAAVATGDQEVPPISTTGAGNITASFNPATLELDFEIAYTLGGDPTNDAFLMHFHGPAPAGQNAPIIVNLNTFLPASPNNPDNGGGADGNANTASGITGSVTLTPEQADFLLNGLVYLNIHSDTFTAGELRAQLIPNVTELPTVINVTITNVNPTDGNFLTPVFLATQDGIYDMFSQGSPASLSVERVAEDGTTADRIQAALNSGGVQSAVATSDGPVAPGDSRTVQFVVSSSNPLTQYLSYMSMVIPSNDAFIGNDDPLAIDLFNGSDLITRIGANAFMVPGSGVWDAGTEVNDEIPENTAFLGQTVPDTGTVENGVVELHPGFQGSVGFGGPIGNVLQAFPEGDFTRPNVDMMAIQVTNAVTSPVPDSIPQSTP